MKKTIKQYVYINDLSSEQLDELKHIALYYTNTKNYFYSRYSGIKSYNLIFNHRKEIRDVMVKESNNYNFKIPSRYWKNALDEAISNIKSNWSNNIKQIKRNIQNNDNLNDHSKHYCNYILTSKEHLYKVLNGIKFNIPDKINYNDINKISLNKLIKRQIRKCKSKISYSYKKSNFILDTSMYGYENGFIKIQGLNTGKRIILKVNNDEIFDKTIRIIINKDKITIASQIEIKIKKNDSTNNIIGIDKNYENVIATSNNNVYGEGINSLYNKYTDIISKKEKNKNKIRAIVKNLKEKDNNNSKIDRIIKNNLGNKKINNKKNKIKEEFKSLINKSLNDFIETEKPNEIIYEDLTFKSNKKKGNKKTRNKLNSWCKGYVQERINYKSYQNNIKQTEVNAAYTSQTCGFCGFYANKRSEGDMFYCPHCGKGVNVHLNSANVILNRKYDNEIKLRMNPKKVETILKERNQRLLEFKTGTTKTQDVQTHHSEYETLTNI